jgi:hypothetical protein
MQVPAKPSSSMMPNLPTRLATDRIREGLLKENRRIETRASPGHGEGAAIMVIKIAYDFVPDDARMIMPLQIPSSVIAPPHSNVR